MKKTLSIITLIIATITATHSQVVQHVMLKNGSILNGYVQQASNGILTFHSANAMVVLQNAQADITDQSTIEAHLDSAWVDWAEKNDAFEGVGSQRTLNLSTIILRGGDFSTIIDEEVADSVLMEIDPVTAKPTSSKPVRKDFAYYLQQKRTIANVYVLERGAQLRYMEQTPNTYTFTWADVASMRVDRRPRTALSGIDCIYELRNNRQFEGQPAGETENTLSLYINGTVQSFPIDDVIKYTYKGINPNQDILEQSELLDVVRKYNGTILRGLIIEQNYSSAKDNENYILLKDQAGAIHSIRISEVAETMKEVNPAYKPQDDVLLNVGDVLVNRQKMNTVGVSERDYVLTLDSLCRNNVIAAAGGPSTTIAVEYRTADAANIEMFRLVRVTRTEVKRKAVYSFSYKDLSEAAVRPISVATSVNQTTRAEYQLPSAPSAYALYNDKTRTAIPLVINRK